MRLWNFAKVMECGAHCTSVGHHQRWGRSKFADRLRNAAYQLQPAFATRGSGSIRIRPECRQCRGLHLIWGQPIPLPEIKFPPAAILPNRDGELGRNSIGSHARATKIRALQLVHAQPARLRDTAPNPRRGRREISATQKQSARLRGAVTKQMEEKCAHI